MVKSESRVVLVLLLIRQLKTVLGMQMNIRKSYIWTADKLILTDIDDQNSILAPSFRGIKQKRSL